MGTGVKGHYYSLVQDAAAVGGRLERVGRMTAATVRVGWQAGRQGWLADWLLGVVLS